ncbi:MAG: FHA domain-containing protein [Pyrinomonadaceae bacterium]|nr:FHA domain-containing protein [Pyrinomonadaceae bacterium]
MQITFAEEIKGQQLNERSFDAPVVAVGRNPATCKIVFDQKQWPTVSRRHAQFQLHNDSWFLADSGSTYGTFLNGQLVKEPTQGGGRFTPAVWS